MHVTIIIRIVDYTDLEIEGSYWLLERVSYLTRLVDNSES